MAGSAGVFKAGIFQGFKLSDRLRSRSADSTPFRCREMAQEGEQTKSVFESATPEKFRSIHQRCGGADGVIAVVNTFMKRPNGIRTLDIRYSIDFELSRELVFDYQSCCDAAEHEFNKARDQHEEQCKRLAEAEEAAKEEIQEYIAKKSEILTRADPETGVDPEKTAVKNEITAMQNNLSKFEEQKARSISAFRELERNQGLRAQVIQEDKKKEVKKALLGVLEFTERVTARSDIAEDASPIPVFRTWGDFPRDQTGDFSEMYQLNKAKREAFEKARAEALEEARKWTKQEHYQMLHPKKEVAFEMVEQVKFSKAKELLKAPTYKYPPCIVATDTDTYHEAYNLICFKAAFECGDKSADRDDTALKLLTTAWTVATGARVHEGLTFREPPDFSGSDQVQFADRSGKDSLSDGDEEAVSKGKGKGKGRVSSRQWTQSSYMNWRRRYCDRLREGVMLAAKCMELLTDESGAPVVLDPEEFELAFP